VAIVNAELLEGTLKEPSVVTISYHEKPGIQALAITTPDLPPWPNQLAGLDLHTGRVTEIVSDHHASADFIALLGKLDEKLSATDPPSAAARQPRGARPGDLSPEVQNGRNQYWLAFNRTVF
jgi:hypothetical protein